MFQIDQLKKIMLAVKLGVGVKFKPKIFFDINSYDPENFEPIVLFLCEDVQL